MFWDGNQYQPISCNQKLGDTLVVALDSSKTLHFKKITQPDTISFNAIGAIWYVKYRGGIELYTAAGFHPIDPRLRVRPITAYIIRKYLHEENPTDVSEK